MNPEPERGQPPWLPPADYSRVVVSCTARLRGVGPTRLPDRRDERGVIGALLVETAHDAADVFSAIDVAGRTIFVDVERKQAVDLVAAAQRVVRTAELAPVKPNDVTVRSLDVMVTHRFGLDIRGLRCAVIGTGNLAFKAALLLAERDAEVTVHGRSARAATQVALAINSILPRHASHPVRHGTMLPPQSASSEVDQVGLLVTAVTAVGVVGPAWLPQLRADVLVVDVGIDNLSEGFLEVATGQGLDVIRLDTRATSGQLNQAAPGFMNTVFGTSQIEDVPIISGGIIGRRGSVVVDSHGKPTRMLGVANGRGGLLPAEDMTESEKGVAADVQALLRDRQARP